MFEPSAQVLLVGGLPDTRLLQEYLVEAGSGKLEIASIERLDKVLERMSGRPLDIVLLDLPLGKQETGMIHAIRLKEPHVPIVWLSGSRQELPDFEFPEDAGPEFTIESRDDPQAVLHAIRYAVLRARSQKTLRESEERFRIACEASHAMVYDLDAVTGRARFIHGLQDLLGHWSGEELQSKDWWFSRIHEDDLPSVVRQLRNARSRGEDYSIQYRMRHKNGNYIVVEDSGRNVVDPDGRTIRSVGSVVDITQRKEAADALRRSGQRYHKLVEELERTVEERTADLWTLNRTLEMITGCDKAIVRAVSEEGLLRDVCRIIVETGGYQVAWIGFAQRDTGKTILPVAQAGQGEICQQSVRSSWAEGNQDIAADEAIRTGRASVRCGLQKSTAGQSRCGHPSSIALPLRSDGECFGALVICSSLEFAFDDAQAQVLQGLADDLTFGITALRTKADLHIAMRDLEQRSIQLRTLATELTQAEERERKRLAQAIHDDLQQLLVGAKFCADTLTTGAQTAIQTDTAGQLNEFLKEAIESARSLSFELSPPVLHNTGLARALHYLGRRMEAKHGLTVHVKTDEQAEPEIEELRILLFQSTRELLFNVVKHAGVKTAEVEMARFKDNCVQITVSDHGAGFDPDKCSSENSQNGFGLFSIRGRLDLVGGRLEIRSAPGSGSRCTMIAPLYKTELAERSTWQAASASAASQAKPKGGLMRAGSKFPNRDFGKSK